jgi:hypothetical protein
MSQGEVRNLFKHEIMPLLAPAVRRLFSRVEPQHLLKVEEIRMRSGATSYYSGLGWRIRIGCQ